MNRKAFTDKELVNALIAVPLGIALWGVGLYFVSGADFRGWGPNTYFGLGILALIALQVAFFGGVFIGAPLHYVLVKLGADNLFGYILAGLASSLLIVSFGLLSGALLGESIQLIESFDLLIFYGTPPIVIATIFGFLQSRRSADHNAKP